MTRARADDYRRYFRGTVAPGSAPFAANEWDPATQAAWQRASEAEFGYTVALDSAQAAAEAFSFMLRTSRPELFDAVRTVSGVIEVLRASSASALLGTAVEQAQAARAECFASGLTRVSADFHADRRIRVADMLTKYVREGVPVVLEAVEAVHDHRP